MNVKVERFFGFLLRVTGAHGSNFQLEMGRFLETAPKVEAPYASLINNIKLLSLITLDNIVLDVLLNQILD